MREYASINELAVISNLENLNAEMIKSGESKQERFKRLKQIAKDQLARLKEIDVIKSIRKESEFTYLDAPESEGKEDEK